MRWSAAWLRIDPESRRAATEGTPRARGAGDGHCGRPAIPKTAEVSVSEPVSTDQPRAPTADGVRPVDPTQRAGGLDPRSTEGSVWGQGPRPQAPPPASSAPRPGASAGEGSSGASGTQPATGIIGRLSRVKATDLWTDGRGLAGWLVAAPEPLSEALGQPPFEFATSGSNILLGTSADQHAVCVVCEVGPSSDEGLGVLLRVAAVQEGGLVVWVAGELVDAHVAALSWLNRSTTPRYYFVRVTGIRIDASASAPIFELVTRPARAAGSEAGLDRSGPGVDVPRRRVEDHEERRAEEPAADR